MRNARRRARDRHLRMRPSLGAAGDYLPGLWAVSLPPSRRSHVHRRGILDLAATMECANGHNPLAYITYGCYCGLGGSGQPQDTIDWCCQRHDCCYARTEKAGCSPKVDSYSWQCVSGKVLCGPVENKCQDLSCKCDQQFAYCLAKAKYNMKYFFFPQFLCGVKSPKCD
ncbi:PREDICTED: group 10 secretory phospholipase A2 [Condylura cristata]|uniref:group 10 secretory phospholipase A2 n=1 Tax=Condylura cristata TaxID=143302 RepID=UPI0003344838|nr:PREDICTED: group 10 secretory phospholipase A2 [Condylura cristata]